MDVITSVTEMQLWSREARKAGRVIACVPTMGFLHDGHLALMREGKRRGDVLVVTIFVNPTQFGIGEDFDQYPRDLEGDKKLTLQVGTDIIFAPPVAEMYPHGYQTFVTVDKVTQALCGLSRPTHFQGVTTVVAKLFNIIQPHVAVFGEKDYQQLVVIRRMVKDLNFNIEIIGYPIVREKDGLAMSSRNKYLNEEERKAALCLWDSLNRAERLYHKGERSAPRLIQEMDNRINAEKLAEVDYIRICNAETLVDSETIDGNAVIALAVRFGKTRLIDNRSLK
ncbi:MAG: pantoate--beta-alanine ligase [Deltaproteobacteria bacterium]|nr:pantoate--beta-alanine ligase [Deltaproteobacteria bacterium]